MDYTIFFEVSLKGLPDMDKFHYLDFENDFRGTSNGQKHWYLRTFNLNMRSLEQIKKKKLESSKY